MKLALGGNAQVGLVYLAWACDGSSRVFVVINLVRWSVDPGSGCVLPFSCGLKDRTSFYKAARIARIPGLRVKASSRYPKARIRAELQKWETSKKEEKKSLGILYAVPSRLPGLYVTCARRDGEKWCPQSRHVCDEYTVCGNNFLVRNILRGVDVVSAQRVHPESNRLLANRHRLEGTTTPCIPRYICQEITLGLSSGAAAEINLDHEALRATT